MNVFKIDKFYRYTQIALFVGTAILFCIQYSQATRLESFIVAAAMATIFMIALYSWSVKVTIEEGNITKSSLLGKKSFPVKSIDEITHIALMGRYSFLLITPETFLAISSLLENFAQLSGYLKDNLTDEAYKNMGVITPTMLDRKTLYMKGIMVVLIAISIAAIVYRVISTDFRL